MQPQATQTPPKPETQTPPAAQPAAAPSAPAPAAPNAPAKSGYGKRPVWQWVLIYLVIAVVVYGIVYFVWIRDGGSGTGY